MIFEAFHMTRRVADFSFRTLAVKIQFCISSRVKTYGKHQMLTLEAIWKTSQIKNQIVRSGILVVLLKCHMIYRRNINHFFGIFQQKSNALDGNVIQQQKYDIKFRKQLQPFLIEILSFGINPPLILPPSILAGIRSFLPNMKCYSWQLPETT